jgi:tetratricopeptide (TPR) repeat protein
LDAAAANWVQEDGQPFTNVYLAYLCNAPPGYYGIKAINLPAKVNEPPPAMPLEAGIYCISATRLQQVYDIPISRWTPILEDAYQSCVNRVRAAQGMELLVGSELQNANPARDELSMRLRFARLCAALRQREPDDRAGYSILIYRMTEDEIQRALFGPPPELHADTPEGACEFAPSLVRAGDRDRAATILQWATETDPDYANARHWLGFALHQLGRRQEAVRQYVEALTLDPDTPGAYTNLGLCLAELGRLSEAIEMYRQAIRLEPLLPEARLNLGKALAAAGQCSDAIRAGQRAVELRSADPGLRTGLAEIRARCNPIEGSSSKRGMESGASAAVWPRQPGPTPCCLSR